jgi:Flp pilus assembly protein TadG
MLEMVIVLPLLLLMLFGMAEFGLAFGRWLTINNAAREGAREAIVFRQDCEVAPVEAEVLAVVQNYTSVLGLTVEPADISIAGVCGGGGSNASVTVSIPYDFLVLDAIAPSLGASIPLEGSSVMRNEG